MKVTKSEQEWREQLTPEAFYVCREHGTETAFSGEYYSNKEDGIYLCTCCKTPLFASDTKFASKTGWPSYFESIKSAVTEVEDISHGITRVEIVCSTCNAHLGHLFPDGPEPTGQRYCINSVCLDFQKK